MRVKLLGKVWNLVYAPLRSRNGLCDGPHIRNKTITIDPSLRGEKELEITLHELLHACDWMKDEEWVRTAAVDIARVLTRLGYTKQGAAT